MCGSVTPLVPSSQRRAMVSENGLDDPDQQFYENFVCGAERNYGGYCDPELERMVDRQSMEADLEKRCQLVWQIEKRFCPRAAICAQPRVKGLTQMVNSIHNGLRFEDVWLEAGVGSSTQR